MKLEPINYATVATTRVRLRTMQWVNLATSSGALLFAIIAYVDPWYRFFGFHSGPPGSTWGGLFGFLSVLMAYSAAMIAPIAWFECMRGRIERISLVLVILYWLAIFFVAG